jgi:hypothetical protein
MNIWYLDLFRFTGPEINDFFNLASFINVANYAIYNYKMTRNVLFIGANDFIL